MPDLAGLHQFVERGERLGDRRFVVGALRRPSADARRARSPRHQPVGKVDLVEIDIVGAEPVQRLVDRVEDIRAHEPRRPAAAEPVVRRAADHLGRQHHAVAVVARLHPRADDALGASLRFGFRRDRIELGRVDEVDAVLEREVELDVAVGLGVLLAEGHRPEADFRDKDAGAAKPALFHR